MFLKSREREREKESVWLCVWLCVCGYVCVCVRGRGGGSVENGPKQRLHQRKEKRKYVAGPISNLGPLAHESDALPTAQRGPVTRP